MAQFNINNNIWWRLVKDLLFVALCFWLLVKGRFLGILVGGLGLYWYGRDLFLAGRGLIAAKKNSRTRETEIRRPEEGKGKITTTDLSDVKEVDFEKE